MIEKIQIIISLENNSFTKFYQRNSNYWPHCVQVLGWTCGWLTSGDQGWNQSIQEHWTSAGNLGVLRDQNTPHRSRSCTQNCVQIPHFPLKQINKELTQASDVTHASETITGTLPRPRFHQVGTNEQSAIFPVSRSRRWCHQRSWQTVMSWTVYIPSEEFASI